MKKYLKIFGYEKEEITPLLEQIFKDAAMAEYTLDNSNLDNLLTVEGEYDSDIDKYLLIAYDVFGKAVYADDDFSLSKCIGDYMRLSGGYVATAESLTGGLVAARIVDVPGASDYFYFSQVTYNEQAKIDYLGVSAISLKEHGAVSPDVCYQMAVGLLKDNHVSYGVSTTGLASIGGEESEEKPVGLTYIGISDDVKCEVFKYIFKGTRSEIRNKAANAALFRLLSRLKTPVDFSSIVVD